MSKTNYLRKRVLALFLALTMCLSLVQVTAFASEGEEQADPVITDTTEQDTDTSAVEEDDENASKLEETNGDASAEEATSEDASKEEEANGDASAEEESEEDVSEKEETNEDISKEETPADGTPECICKTKCGEGSVNEDCPVCGAEDADLTACKGEEVPAEVPAQVQAFLDAVAALSALADEEGPDADAVLEAQNAVIEAYDALSEDQKSELGEDYAAMVAGLKEVVTLEEEPVEKLTVVFDSNSETMTISGNGTLQRNTLVTGDVDESTTIDTFYKSVTNNNPKYKVTTLVVNGPGVNLDGSSEALFTEGGTVGYSIQHIILNNAKIDTRFGLSVPTLEVYGGTFASGVEQLVSGSELKELVVGPYVDDETGMEYPAAPLGDYAFCGYSALESIFIDGAVVKDTMFSECGSITDVTIKNVQTAVIPSLKTYDYELNEKIPTKLCLENVDTFTASSSLMYVGFESLTLKNVKHIPASTFKEGSAQTAEIDWASMETIGNSAFSGAPTLVSGELNLSNATSIGTSAFYNGAMTSVTFGKAVTIGGSAFLNCPQLATVTMDEGGTIGTKAFQGCTALNIIHGLNKVTFIDGRAFESCDNLDLGTSDTDENGISADAKLGYSGIFLGVNYLEARMQAILGGKFGLDLVDHATDLQSPDWADTKHKIGTKNGIDKGDTQITKEAEWADTSKTVADVKLQFSHSEKPSMDFLFVVDLSNSMAFPGNVGEQNSRFFVLQSKLIDVATKLVANKDYNNQVGFVTFGGSTKKGLTDCHIYSTLDDGAYKDGFTDDPNVVANFAGLVTPKVQNTDYVTAFTKAEALVNAHENGDRSDHDLTIIFISDGKPNMNGAVSSNWSKTEEALEPILTEIKGRGVEIFSVMLMVPTENIEDQYVERVMKDISTNNQYFRADDYEQFSTRINEAIAATYSTYTIVDTVGKDFELVPGSIQVSNSEYTSAVYDEKAKTITWTIHGIPLETYTLSFQEKLHDDLVNRVGTYTYDTNDGDATVNEDVNAVETPQLERTVNPPAPNRYTVTVNYYLAGTTTPVPGTEPHTETLTDGDSYNVTAYDRISVPGYTYSSTEGALTGIMDGNKVINVYYTRDPDNHTVTVNYYLLGTTTVLRDPYQVTLPEGTSYDVSGEGQPAIPGYTYSSTTGDTLTGTLDGNKVINVYYTANTPVIPPVIPPVTPTPIPDNPTPLNPGPDGTTIPDQDVPLAAPGLNSVDHYAYIIGYPDGLVHPEANVTRAEVATIFFRLMTDEFRAEHWAMENAFLDVAAQEWFNNSVSTSSRAGIVKGYEDGSFRPNNNITRAEFAAIAARFLSDEVNISSSFSDISGHWAEEEINRAVMAGWIKGYTDGTFRPNQPITRAEAVTMINRMLDRTPDKDHMLENMIRWDDNTEDKWYYADMQEATNSHDYERLEMVLIEDWTELLENRDWAALQKEWATAASAPGGEVADNLDLSKIGENGVAQDAEAAEPANA